MSFGMAGVGAGSAGAASGPAPLLVGVEVWKLTDSFEWLAFSTKRLPTILSRAVEIGEVSTQDPEAEGRLILPEGVDLIEVKYEVQTHSFPDGIMIETFGLDESGMQSGVLMVDIVPATNSLMVVDQSMVMGDYSGEEFFSLDTVARPWGDVTIADWDLRATLRYYRSNGGAS